MTRLKQTVMGPYAPDDPNVFWVDTSDITAPTIKINLNGAWVALGGESSEPVQADWNQADNTKPDYIKNKPTIPAAQIQSDWNQTNASAKDFIKNKPLLDITNLGPLSIGHVEVPLSVFDAAFSATQLKYTMSNNVDHVIVTNGSLVTRVADYMKSQSFVGETGAVFGQHRVDEDGADYFAEIVGFFHDVDNDKYYVVFLEV